MLLLIETYPCLLQPLASLVTFEACLYLNRCLRNLRVSQINIYLLFNFLFGEPWLTLSNKKNCNMCCLFNTVNLITINIPILLVPYADLHIKYYSEQKTVINWNKWIKDAISYRDKTIANVLMRRQHSGINQQKIKYAFLHVLTPGR